MSPRKTISRDYIIDKAFELVREKGIKALTARNVALAMKASTRPVYSCFDSMDELAGEVITRARDILFDYIARPYTPRVFLNSGIGYVSFARDHKQLFRLLFLESTQYIEIVDAYLAFTRTAMQNDYRFVNMTQSLRDELMHKMWFFVYGFASMICVGFTADDSDTYVHATLDQIGAVVLGPAIQEHPGKSDTSGG